MFNNTSLAAARNKEKSLDIYISNLDFEITQYEINFLIKKDQCNLGAVNEEEYINSKDCNLSIELIKGEVIKHRHFHQFTGEIPKSFKFQIIITNQEEQEVIISDEVIVEAYNGIIYYNVKDNKITVQKVYTNIFALAFFFIVLTFISKTLIYYLHRFSLSEAKSSFLITNFTGLGLISIILSMSNYLDGYVYSFKNFMFLTIVLWLVETFVFIIFVKNYELKKRLLYPLIANLAMFIIGGILTLITII